MLLNCDLGESFGNYTMGMDVAIMPHIDQANIACGFHAGDPVVMRATLRLARAHGVMVGAHPSYPDLQGFGRRSMQLSTEELICTLLYQIAALDGVAASEGVQVQYVKPHGALYNDMMRDDALRATVLQALAEYQRPLALMLQATPAWEAHQREAEARGLTLIFEAFADRAYTDEGRLVPRNQSGAVLQCDGMLAQARQLRERGTITAVSGREITVRADSLCVHGDNPAAVASVAALRELLCDN